MEETKITRLTPDQIKALDEHCTDLVIETGVTYAVFPGSPEDAANDVELRRQQLWKTHGGRGYPVQPLAMVRNKLRKQIAAS